ncbi:class I SAM-dependent methyltransferase [Planctobacterium marinum]|uniref:2-polyprenyl-3-methyl-5-hydroxy-6-metoxy-1,4-benzoquinol methylase n=1 Tax=Planctobacterium marinum TaxID=1631968 RepID=A0AA48KQ63_9ALTE|nr:2-polyprenyl-3-methyl-5-hydroxy-6-metoxy-1,4-benzoquinol methylase [Planctobacterium marinum]
MTESQLHAVKANNVCPLCRSQQTGFYCEDKKRPYLQCENCDLVFVPDGFILSQALEKAEYDKHDNTRLDEGYRCFLNRTLLPVVAQLESRGKGLSEFTGLDFGCGEGAFLSQMAAEKGLEVANYDLYYHHAPQRLNEQYDVIVMTEVLEHIAAPHTLLPALVKQLKPGGFMAVMTKRVIDKTAFAKWHYKNDPTHICFYSEASFQWLADWLELKLTIVANDVVFLQR